MSTTLTAFFWKWKYGILFLLLFFLTLTQRFLNEKQSGLRGSVSTDGTGYYYYLPATLIYQDFSYSFYDEPKNKIKPCFKPYLTPYVNGTAYNKYYCGVSLCLLPFFVSGIAISAVTGTPINGYTDTFLMLVSLAAIVYYLLAVFFITKTLHFFSISQRLSFIGVQLFFFGTNLFHYVIQEPSMSHVYSFFAVSLFFYLFTQLIQKVTTKNLIFVALSFGLIVLIRPPNGVVVLFTPFFFHSFKDFFQFIKALFTSHFLAVCAALQVFIYIVLIQFIFYYIQTGDFFISSYDGEPFYFNNPQILNILFSYKKGLFTYTPLLFAALVFVLFTKGEWNKKISFFFVFSVFTYIAASWWCWWYGGGFGNRPFIDILPLFIICTVYLVNRLGAVSKKIVCLVCLPFVFLNQVMAYQYSNLIIDSVGQVTKESYWNFFLRTDLASINRNRVVALTKKYPVYASKIQGCEFYVADNSIVSPGFKSNYSCKMGSENNFSKILTFPSSELNSPSSLFVAAECMAKTDKAGRNDLVLAVSVSEAGEVKKWDVVYFNQFNAFESGWAHLSNVVRIDKSELINQRVINVFAMTNKGHSLVDNLRYRIIKEPEPK